MSVTNAVLENWPQNCDNFLSEKNIFLYLLVMHFYATKTWDNDLTG